MAKITVEIKKETSIFGEKLQVSEKEQQKVFQIAAKTLALLEEIGWEDRVEIIKATAWKDEYGPERILGLKTDFQVVFSPSIVSTSDREEEKFKKEQRLKVTARWNDRKNSISVYKDEIGPTGDKYLCYLSPEDREIDTLARALIEAMEAGICKRLKELQNTTHWLEEADRELTSLCQVPAKA